MGQTLSEHWHAIVRQRCPVCLEGRVFRSGLNLHERCPKCGLRFEREQGYFLGALYVAYAMAVPILSSMMLALWLAGAGDAGRCFTIAVAMLVPLSPFILRYARVLWLHLDQFLDPRPESQPAR